MIVLTGGTGNLGGAIIQHAASAFPAEGLSISTRNPHGVKTGGGELDIRAGDFDDPSSLSGAFEGADQIVLVSANGSDDERWERNRNAIDAAVAAGARHLVFISYAPVAHGPDLMHAEVTARTEEHLRASRIEYTILRCNYYAQLFLMFVQPAMETGEILLPAGAGRAAMIGYNDIARSVVAALRPNFVRNGTFELSGPAGVGYADLAVTLSSVFGKPIVYRSVDGTEAEAWISRLPVPPQYVPFIAMAAREVAGGYFDHVTGDVEKLTGSAPESADAIWRAALTGG